MITLHPSEDDSSCNPTAIKIAKRTGKSIISAGGSALTYWGCSEITGQIIKSNLLSIMAKMFLMIADIIIVPLFALALFPVFYLLLNKLEDRITASCDRLPQTTMPQV